MKLDEAVAALCFSLEQLAQPVSSCCRGCCARHVAPYLTRNTHTHTHTTHTHTHTQFHVPHSSVMLKPQLCVSVLGYSDIDTSKVMVKCTYFSIVINKFVCVYQHTHTHTHMHTHSVCMCFCKESICTAETAQSWLKTSLRKSHPLKGSWQKVRRIVGAGRQTSLDCSKCVHQFRQMLLLQ